jgi:hypothetical protein
METTMVDETTRKNIGMISVSKLEKEKLWKDYMTASRSFSEAKIRTAHAKQAMKELLRKKSKELADVDFDFLLQGDRLTLYENLRKTEKRQSRGRELELE